MITTREFRIEECSRPGIQFADGAAGALDDIELAGKAEEGSVLEEFQAGS